MRLDESRIFYGLGALLGVAAILYFGRELILELSPVVKSAIMVGGTIGFLAAAQRINDKTLESAFYVFSAFSYLSFLGYVFGTFELGSTAVFLVLASSSAVFLSLGYIRSESDLGISSGHAKLVLSILGVLLVALVMFDVAGAQPEYSAELERTVQVESMEEFSVGKMVVENRFPLPRNLEEPELRGCISKPGGEVQRMFFAPDTGDLIGGNGRREFELRERVVERREGSGVAGNYTVRTGECPGEPPANTLFLETGEDLEVALSFSGDTE